MKGHTRTEMWHQSDRSPAHHSLLAAGWLRQEAGDNSSCSHQTGIVRGAGSHSHYQLRDISEMINRCRNHRCTRVAATELWRQFFCLKTSPWSLHWRLEKRIICPDVCSNILIFWPLSLPSPPAPAGVGWPRYAESKNSTHTPQESQVTSHKW